MLRLAEAVGLDMDRMGDGRAAGEIPLGAIEPALFRGIFGAFPAGVTIVSTLDDACAPIGVTVSAVMSLSLDPPQLLVALGSSKYTMRTIERRGSFAVNFLADDQHPLADRFAQPAADKFAGVAWRAGAVLGDPVLAGVRAHAECHVERIIRSGDHRLVIGRLAAGAANDGSGLVYCDRRYAALTALPGITT
jgi:flavin reductase (DIM6/NTAB) family NADH-FMN oxidoreductase RutF